MACSPLCALFYRALVYVITNNDHDNKTSSLLNMSHVPPCMYGIDVSLATNKLIEENYIVLNFKTLYSNFSLDNNGEISVLCTFKNFFFLSNFENLPTETVHLLIRESNIHTLNQTYFKNFSKLQELILSANNIQTITSEVFTGLSLLTHLDLSYNLISHLEPFLFYPTPNLESLDVTSNRITSIYSFALALSHLDAFTTLNMSDNQVLTNIKTFDLKPLNNSSIQHLNLNDCSIKYVEIGALSFLNNLEILEAHATLLTESSLYNLTASLETTSIAYLDIRYLINLSKFPTRSLAPLARTSLIELDLSKNYFPFITKEDVPQLAIEVLWLNDCSIEKIDLACIIHEKIPTLKKLTLNNNKLISFNFPNTCSINQNSSFQELQITHQPKKFKLNLTNENFEMFPHLRTLIFYSVSFQGNVIRRQQFHGLFNLVILSLQNSNVETIELFAFESMSHSLEVLSLAGNPITILSPNVFMKVNNLRVLHLYDCQLKLEKTEENPFIHLKQTLIQLRIERNDINEFRNDIFKGMKNLKILIASGNKIQPWTTSILDANHSLERFDLSVNKLDGMTQAMLMDLRDVDQVNLEKNPFNCADCPSLRLKVSFQLDNRSRGVLENAICEKPFYYAGTSLWDSDMAECSEPINMLLLTLAVLLGIVLVILLLTYPFYRWHLKLWLYSLKYLCRKQSLDYQYDIFVSYSDEDSNWVENSLLTHLEPQMKLCLHKRDFKPGKEIILNVFENIHKSRMFLAILSGAFLRSQWCIFELHMAQHRLVRKERSGIVAVQLEQNLELTNQSVAVMVATRPCLKISDCDFWDRLCFHLASQDPKKTNEGVATARC